MKRTHTIPILSSRCEGAQCRTCPRPWRYFVTGVELWGRGDNATFWQDATEDYRRKPTEKLSRARWRRVARRWAFLVLPALTAAVSAFTSWWWLIGYLAALFSVGTALLVRFLAAWLPGREMRKLYVYPAARQLAKVTNVRFRRRWAVEAIELPPGFGDEPDGAEPLPVRVYVPETVLDPGTRRRIVDAVGGRLGLPDATAKWTEHGVATVYVDLYPQALPPASVSIEDLMAEIEASPIDRPVIGAAAGGRAIHMDLVNDSPHSLGSAGSGAGKSTLYKLIAMQRLAHGAYAVILDFKKWSHLRWAGRLPSGRVVIEDEVPRIHDTLVRIGDELIWRKSFDLKDEERLAELPTLDVYVEEINSLMALLVSYWTAYVAQRKQAARTALRRAKEAAKMAGAADEVPDELLAAIEEAEEELAAAMGLPKTSPAIDALRFGVNLGREFKIHFHFIGQSMSAKAAGGRDTRESFRTRFLARWDAKTWKMLADGIPYVACPSGTVGIWAHVHGAEYEIVRVPYVPDEVAVEYVRGGRTPALPMFHGDPMPTIEGEARSAIPAAATLKDLAEILPLKADGDRMTLRALREAAKRPGFPARIEKEYGPGEAYLYPPEEVLAWFRDREGLPAIGS